MLDPIIKTIEVSCSQEKAFRIFVNEMSNWWPLDKRSMSIKGGKPAGALRMEPKPGSQIVETGHDDTEHLWGTIKSLHPYDLFSMDFHMGLPAGESASLVEVRFTKLGNERTQVELTQSNWEAFGEMAEMLRGAYGSGWVIIFDQAYKSACDG